MKRFNLLLGFIFLILINVSGQKTSQDSTEYYYKYPQQALTEAEKLYTLGMKGHDSPMLIKSLIMGTAFNLKIDNDRYPEILRELETYIEKEKDIVAKSILQSYLAELYLQYYNQNSYAISQRTDLAGDVPEDMNVWTTHIFKEKVFTNLLASIAQPRPLQTTAISAYQTIMIPGKNSSVFRPTVYDFLCYRTIELLPRFRSSIFKREEKQNQDATILSGLEQFISLKIDVIPLDAQSNILKIYQNLLAFRQQQKNNQEALVLADLDRLDFARRISSNPAKDSLYLSALAGLEKEYGNSPISIEVRNKEALYWKNNALRERGTKAVSSLEKALKICNDGIRQYPDYWRINILKQIIQDIERPELSVSFPQNVYPGEKIEFKITSQNIKNATLRLFKIDMSAKDYLQDNRSKKENILRTLTYENTFNLPETLTEYDSLISIPGTESGLYELRLEIPGHKELYISNHFFCSQLYTNWQPIDDRINFIVRNWVSGKPVKDAKIRIYQHEYNKGYQVIDSVYTNHRGMTAIEQQENCYYQVVNKENKQGDIHGTYFWNSIPQDSYSTIQLITDRKLYRPGQTVYFKGIAWSATTDSLMLDTQKKYSVSFRDVNNKEIGQKEFTTNEFGSFTGHFIIPMNTLNGNFTLQTYDGQTNITVADYKRPEFEITLTPSKDFYNTGDSAYITGHISSFTGMPLSNLSVNYSIEENARFMINRNNDISKMGVTRTDSEGNFEIKFKAEMPAQLSWMRWLYVYEITASATDTKGETQQASTQVTVMPKTYAVTVKIPEIINKEKQENIYFLLHNAEHNTTAQSVKYTIARLKDSGKIATALQLSDTITERTMLEGTLSFSLKDSIQPSFSNYPSGAYLITAETEGTTSKTIFFLYSPKDKRPPVSTYNWLVKENTDCKPGETARITFGTSARDAHILYGLYAAGKMVKQETKIISDGLFVIEIPYKDLPAEKTSVVISYVKDKNYIQNTIVINKAREDRRLTLQTKVFRDKLTPGQKETWEFRVINDKKQGVLAEVLAMMYDASLDQIQPYSWGFFPSYASPYINYEWRNGQEQQYYSRLSNSPGYFNQIEIPAFQFDRLNTYQPEDQFGSPMIRALSSFKTIDATAQLSENVVVTGLYTGAAGNVPDKNKPVSFRQNFQETAFFYPQIKTEENGEFTLKFTVPDATTKWKFSALAYTKELQVGMLEKYITTTKELMITPNLPRFFRTGDSTMLQATVSNLSEKQQTGEARLELFIPMTGEVLFSQGMSFLVEPGKRGTVSFSFRVPGSTDIVGCRISAATKTFSDGEQHLIPILPDNIMVTETLPIYATTKGEHSFSLKNVPSTRKDFRLTLEVATNPVWYAVLALPSLCEARNENVTDIAAAWYVNIIAGKIAGANPEISKAIRTWETQKGDTETLLSQLERNQELKSVLLSASPWVMEAQNETERMQSLIQLFDQNRSSELERQALAKLNSLQLPDGSWSWFKNMPGNRFMTINVLHLMARANSIGEKEFGEAEKMMQIKALRYLDKAIKEDFEKKPKTISTSQLMYLYVRSMYLDIPLGDALNAHKYFISLAQQQWGKFNFYEKAITATTLFRYGFSDNAKKILTSLREYAVKKPDMGMYWPNNQNYATNAAVTVEVAILEAFHTIAGNTPDIDLMKQWLLRQKQVQSWTNTPTTVDAIYALLLTGKDQLAEKETATIKIGSKNLESTSISDPLGYIKQSYPASEITPDMLTVKIDKSTDNPTWGGIYLQYFENLDRIKRTTGGLKVDKQLFIEKVSNNIPQLYSLNKESLKVGDKVVVRLILSLDRDMEFLCLKDLRAACFEPVEQLSGNQWRFGSVYYEEVKDAATNLFFNSLAKGVYVIEYPVWVNQAGVFQDGIATLQSMYAPEYNAFSAAAKIEVKE